MIHKVRHKMKRNKMSRRNIGRSYDEDSYVYRLKKRRKIKCVHLSDRCLSDEDDVYELSIQVEDMRELERLKSFIVDFDENMYKDENENLGNYRYKVEDEVEDGEWSPDDDMVESNEENDDESFDQYVHNDDKRMECVL